MKLLATISDKHDLFTKFCFGVLGCFDSYCLQSKKLSSPTISDKHGFFIGLLECLHLQVVLFVSLAAMLCIILRTLFFTSINSAFRVSSTSLLFLIILFFLVWVLFTFCW
uniref:Uncharacterized protein n=1 Tax=Cacopsylla melanoneura TaxID=428564 RepID=A0A8D8Z944_9HEMI